MRTKFLPVLALMVVGALAALIPAIAMWGFTVDDALITIRYAHHVACGAGYRFNVHGASTDGVTPLPLPWLLAGMAGTDALIAVLERVKVLGVVAWTLASTFLGYTLASIVESHGGRGRRRMGFAIAALSLLVMAIAFPLGAWAASGMETAFVMTLTTIAASFAVRDRQPRSAMLAALIAGVATSLRPELVVWAIFLAGGIAGSARARAQRVGLAFLPFLVCVLIRLTTFGRPTPLALMAKPSDFAHGLSYGIAGAIVVLTPLLAFAPLSIAQAPNKGIKALAIAALAHVVVVIAVGGDWMPYARLMVPVAPSLVLSFVDTTLRAPGRAPLLGVVRAVLVMVLGVALVVTSASRGRSVHEDRKDLIAKARPVLASSKVIASLDIGWTAAAASSDATIVDLAGVTDPEIAALAGGHTSKAVDLGMLLDRNVDTLVIYSPPRHVEMRLMRSSLFESRFERVADVPLGRQGAHYSIYRVRVRDNQRGAD